MVDCLGRLEPAVPMMNRQHEAKEQLMPYCHMCLASVFQLMRVLVTVILIGRLITFIPYDKNHNNEVKINSNYIVVLNFIRVTVTLFSFGSFLGQHGLNFCC